jgi:glucose/arabinose dehydrogenase
MSRGIGYDVGAKILRIRSTILKDGVTFMKTSKSLNSRIVLAGLIAAGFAGLVAMAQHVQPQVDKLPTPVPGTPNFGSVAPKPAGAELKVPAGFTVSVYAENLTTPRYMVYAPNDDLFVSSFAGSSITVFRDGKNLGTFAGRAPAAAPAGPPAGAPAPGGGAGRGGGQGGGGGAARGGARGPAPATALPTANPASAVACTNTTVPAGAVGINQPQGMAFHNGYLYVANTNSIVRYKYTNGDTTAQGTPRKTGRLNQRRARLAKRHL